MGIIRALRTDDWEGWSGLWAGYLSLYRAELDDLTTQSTFERLCAGNEGMFGLLALDDAGQGIGMANCVVHGTTWSRRPKCYLEDLFVSPASRGGDLGQALLRAVKQAATMMRQPAVITRPSRRPVRRSFARGVSRQPSHRRQASSSAPMGASTMAFSFTIEASPKTANPERARREQGDCRDNRDP